jgi:hypothetical protein
MNINTSSAVAHSGSRPSYGDAAGFKVDLSRGERVGRVSSEWFSRPDDERYLSLPELYGAVRARADHATARNVESRAIRVCQSASNFGSDSNLMQSRCRLALFSQGNQRHDDSSATFRNRPARLSG